MNGRVNRFDVVDYRVRCTTNKPWPACRDSVDAINRVANVGNVFVVPINTTTLNLDKTLVQRTTTFLVDNDTMGGGATIVLPLNPDEGQVFVITSVGTTTTTTLTGNIMTRDGSTPTPFTFNEDTLKFIATFKPITIPGTTPTPNTVYPIWIQL